MRKLTFIILIVSFSAIYYYSTSPIEGSFVHKSVSNIKKMIKNSTHPAAPVINSAGASSVAVTSQNLNTSESLQELTIEELNKWVETEAQSMNSTGNDTEELQLRLRALSQTLQPQQLVILTEMAINSQLPINSRIFSAYTITLNSSLQSQESLFNVAKSEVPDFGPVLPHSEAELRHTQELAIRYMQIDELFQRAKTDTNAFDKLKLLSQEAQSTQVRSYAAKKLKELK